VGDLASVEGAEGRQRGRSKVKPISIQDLGPEGDKELYLKVKEGIRTLAGGDLVSSNLALTLWIQSLLLLAAFGVDREWCHAAIDEAWDSGGMEKAAELHQKVYAGGNNALPMMPKASE
jgi:hypothetical protein